MKLAKPTVGWELSRLFFLFPNNIIRNKFSFLIFASFKLFIMVELMLVNFLDRPAVYAGLLFKCIFDV
jgi:hypothetical protein